MSPAPAKRPLLALPLLAAVAMAMAMPVRAAEPEWTGELGAGVERLSNDSPDWRELQVSLRRRQADGALLELQARRAQRYGATDHELGAGVAWALSPQWSAGFRGTVAGAADFLPRRSLAADLTGKLGDGWVATGGLARQQFDPADGPKTGTTLLRLGVERYVGAWRLAAGGTRGRLDGGAAANGWRAQVDRFFGDTDRIGLLVAGGRELEAITDGVVSTRVDTVVLLARWRVAPGWSLNADVGRTRVSDIQRRTGAGLVPLPGGYHRDGVHLGVQREF